MSRQAVWRVRAGKARVEARTNRVCGNAHTQKSKAEQGWALRAGTVHVTALGLRAHTCALGNRCAPHSELF